MKKLMLILFAASGFIIGCNESDLSNLTIQQPENQVSLNSVTNFCVVTVSPTGVDDTKNIEDAFKEAVDHSAGSIVEFKEGIFYISEPIVVANFNGTFRGAGKDKTIIKNISDIEFPLMTTGPEAGMSAFFYFYNEGTGSITSIHFEDMSFVIEGKSAEFSTHYDPSDSFGSAITFHGGVSGESGFEASYADLSFEHISFKGLRGNEFIEGWNLWSGITIFGENILEYYDDTFLFHYNKPLSGNVIIKDCDFQTMICPVALWAMKNSKIEILNNKLNDAGYGFWTADFDNVVTNISFNSLTDIKGFGFLLEQSLTATEGLNFGPYPELFPEAPAKYYISYNDLHLIDPADGIGLLDYGLLNREIQTLDAVITKNSFFLDETNYGGIAGYFVQNILVGNNYFFGTGAVGVYLGFSGAECSGWVIKSNNFNNLSSYFIPVWLGQSSENCLVIGGNNHINVYDEGENNVLVGVNNKTLKIGPEIKEALKTKREMIKSLRR